MQTHPTPKSDDRTTLATSTTAVSAALAAAGAVVLMAASMFGAGPPNQVFHLLEPRFAASYLVSYCFFLSLSLGGLFFVALQHLTRAGWSVAVRRLAEILATNVVWWAVLFLPILFPVMVGKSPLYVWSRPEAVAADPLLQWKSPYLNATFFAARAVGYFVIWGLLARFFFVTSLRQDKSGDPHQTRRMEKLAPAALVLFGLTITFAAFDWLMSLEPAWFSTIFGVYFFSGSVVGALAAMILFALALQAGGLLRRTITTEHYHELGKLLLGFVIFWGYIAFSQYMLIWYANVPEESVWYLARQTGGWEWVGLGLLFGHLLIPFLGLLPRVAKRRRMVLGVWAAWMLVFHWIDIYWLVMPTFEPQGPAFGLIDVGCMVGLGCLFLAGIVRLAGAGALAPLGDPRLDESLAFENF